MILLDTHALVWLVEDSRRLGRAAREAVGAEAELCLSAMTLWELSMLLGKGQVALAMPLAALLNKVMQDGVAIIPVTALIAMDANGLPKLHGDPVDRLLMATARSLDCPLMTADHVIEEYAAAGHVRIIDARR